MTPDETAKVYDAGYTNALMQLHKHIREFVDKPNAQTKKVLDLILTMLEVQQENKK